MDYRPTPIDTSGLELGDEILGLAEQLAEHVHDTWAAARLADGWTYGPRRDDDKKEHPSLVPYDQLPESERKYDRATAFGTLKAILKLGYTIQANGRDQRVR